jgi:hypothetical protein
LTGPPTRRGVPVVAWILIAIAALGLFTCGGLVLWVSQTEQGRQIREIVRTGYEVGVESTQAPGTEELRELGCSQAMVMSAEQARAFANAVTDERDEVLAEFPPDLTMIMCQLNMFADADIECDDVARTYVEATRPEGRLLVQVQKGRASAGCTGIYSSSGELLEIPELD